MDGNYVTKYYLIILANRDSVVTLYSLTTQLYHKLTEKIVYAQST